MAEQKFAEVNKAPSPGTEQAPAIRFNWRNLLDSRRILWLVAATAVAVFSTIAATVQPLRPNALVEPERFSVDWWTYPAETNAFKRLPVIPETLNDTAILSDGDTLVAVGDNGLIVRSTDSGRSWQKAVITAESEQQSKNSTGTIETFANNFMAAHAADETDPKLLKKQQKSEAYAPASPNIELPNTQQQQQQQPEYVQQEEELKQPIEGSAKSELTPYEVAVSSALKSVSFIGNQNGWAVGANGVVLHSQDGGSTWEIQSSGVRDNLNAVQFLDAQHGFAVGDKGTIVETTDGGQRWRMISRGNTRLLVSYITADIQSLHFISDQNGWVVGGYGSVYATTDGGRSWREQPSGTSSWLLSVQFLDAQRGWAVGASGTILSTADGGASWQTQTSGPQWSLYSVQFLDDQRGSAVGSDGTILHTQNGGASWQTQDSRTQSWLYSVQFLDAQRGWAVGRDGTILTTANSGDSWQKQTSGTQNKLNSVQFLDAQRGWAVGGDGTILTTADGGASWQTQDSRTQNWLFSVQFLDAQRGWAVGDNGTILSTADGGASWQTQDSRTPSRLYSVQFLNAQRGWAVGRDGTILSTADGGASWQTQGSDKQSWLYSVQFLDAQRGAAVGSDGTILHTQDGGASWQTQDSRTQSWLYSVQFLDAQRGWVVGDNGTILSTADGGDNWQTQDSRTQSRLYSVQFLNAQRGWAVGRDGTILSTAGGGDSWQIQTSDTQSGLFSVQFLDAQRGWVVGDNSTILSTANGGASWQDIAPSRSPAPWYYVSWLITLLLLIPALNPKEQRKPNSKDVSHTGVSIADQVSSDRPLTRDDPDPLGFGRIAASVSRFLRHEKTTGPLTLAISGRWGSGKSSLMNLISSDLQRHGFVPVWFNAWHNQNEENLLDALVTSIRQQGRQRFFTSRPPFINPYWFSFFARRVYRWSTEHYIQTLVLVCAVTVAVTLYRDNIDLFKTHTNSICHYFFEGCFAEKDALATDDSIDKEWIVWLIGAILTAAGGPIALFRSLRTLPRIRRSRGPEFRGQYAKYFRNFNDNLKPMSLIVFIDDLDRCGTDTVMRTLEATNYLVSSGDCFVVLGMDYNIVRNSVAVGYKDLAAQIKEDHSEDSQAAFANEYLEKLINIQLEVPTMESAQMLQLALPETLADSVPLEKRFSRWVYRYWKEYWRLLFLACVVIAGVQLGNHLNTLSESNEEKALKAAAKEAVTKSVEPAVVDNPIDTGNNRVPEIDERANESAKSADIVTPTISNNTTSYLYVPIALILLVGVWVLMRGRDDIQYDSNTFEDALKIWLPLASQRRETPRAVKRFVNRTRYFAMRLRDERRISKAEADKESTIVALSAIHQIDPDIINKPESEVADIVTYFKQDAAMEELGLSDEIIKSLAGIVFKASSDHEGTFETNLAEEITHTLPLFREISRGIQVK